MTTLLVIIIMFLGALSHATFGFGTALVAMPLLALVIDIQAASALVAFVILTNTVLIIWNSWRSVDLRSAWQLVLGSVVGIPVGLLLLKNAPEEVIKGILGLFLIIVSLYNLFRPTLKTMVVGRGWAYFLGFLGGVFGAAYNTNGPPVVLYGALKKWPPAQFRATLQGYFLPVGVIIWLGHGLSRLWTPTVLWLYASSLPGVFLALVLGSFINRRIPAQRFERLLYLVLIGLGLLLLL